MVDSIVNTLGAGSGIDITALVNSLVDAQFSAKNQQIAKQTKALSSQISAVGQLKSNLASFATGLSTLVTGGTLTTQPTSSNTDVLKTSALSGAKLNGLSAQVEVRKLAQAQAATTAPVGDRTAAIGTGTLTLTFGTASVTNGAFDSFTPGAAAPVPITIDAAHSSLDQIAARINAAKAGVTATIVTDSNGARLTLKGASGEAQAFTLTATEDPGAPGLAALNIGPGATGTIVGTAAQDALVVVDGVPLKRSSNAISDLIDGVKLDLVSAKPGTVVTLGTSAPSENIRQSVNDFVTAYNDLQRAVKADTDATSGALRNDAAAKSLQQSLGRFTLTKLANPTTTGAPSSLADIGISTNRDGTISVNAARLTSVLTNYPDEVEALFANGTGATGGGISAAFKAIADQATNATYGLGASETRYTKAQTDLSTQQDKLASDTETVRTRLTKQFSGADARIAAYKQTQTLLTQQIAQWNAQKN